MARDNGRDPVAELDSTEQYLLGLCGDGTLPGFDSLKPRLFAEIEHLKSLADQAQRLAEEYAAGVTQEDRIRRNQAGPADEQAAELARLRARVAELEGSG